MTLIRSNYLGHILHAVDPLPTNTRDRIQIEDGFDGRVQPSALGLQQRLEKMGVAGVCNGKIQPLTFHQIEKVGHLAEKSDIPLFFIMDLNENGEIAGASSYAEKSKWIVALHERGLGDLPFSILKAESGGQSQLNILRDLLGAARTGL